ncbi:MAG: hypothetical protein Q7U20_01300 [Caulobacter sp.]|nr:hypothetical protein [Caulobacter sp.]
MKPSKTTVVLGGLLAASLLGNAWLGAQAFNGGIWAFYKNMYRDQEIIALRRFGERVAAGEAPRAVLLDLGGSLTEERGWLNNGTLKAKFEGDRLVEICGSLTTQRDSCKEVAE